MLPNSEKRVSGSRSALEFAPGTPGSFHGSHPAEVMCEPIFVRMKMTLGIFCESHHIQGRPMKTGACPMVLSSTEGSRSRPATSEQSRKTNPLAEKKKKKKKKKKKQSVLSIVQ